MPINLPSPDMSRLSHLPLTDRMAAFTEMQLATIEDLRERKRFPKSELERQEGIAANMVQTCREFWAEIRPTGRGGPNCSRLRAIMDEREKVRR